MRTIALVVAFSLAGTHTPVRACSCFGPSTFCETLYPHYDEGWDPSWWTPDNVVLGVKLSTVEYGVDILVVQDLLGGLKGGEVIRVWGDCGLLCRMSNTWIADGDTVLWAIHDCDLAGNFLCPGDIDFEEEGHFQLSACGIYSLGYSSGVVTGPLFTEGATESVSITSLAELVNGCLSSGIIDPTPPLADIRYAEGQLFISTTGGWSTGKQVCITDVAGRLVMEDGFRGPQASFMVPRRMNGLMLVRVSDGERSIAHRVIFN